MLSRRTLLNRAFTAGTAFGVMPPDPELPRAAGRPKKVIVVGAGMAGLISAFELVQQGHQVTVLESRGAELSLCLHGIEEAQPTHSEPGQNSEYSQSSEKRSDCGV